MVDPQNEDTTIFQGFGWIKINNKRQLNFNLYITDIFIESRENKSTFFPEYNTYRDKDGYYHFIAHDIDGIKWNFKTFNYGSNKNFSSITSINSSIDYMSSFGTLDSYSNSCIEFILPPDIQTFYNKLDTLHEYNSDKELIGLKNEFCLDINYDHLKIYGKKTNEYNFIGFYSDNFHDNSDLRLIEGLQLITGYRIRPYLVYKQIHKKASLKINSKEYNNTDTILPPLRIHEFPSQQSHYPWDIFLNYINTFSGSKEKRFTPIGSIINSIIGSSGAFFEIQILVLCVRIEGMLNILFPKMGKPRETTVSQIDILIDYISKWTGESTIKKRATKIIGNMKSVRAEDKLHILLAMGIINNKQYDSWKKLRNASAHSAIGNKNDNWHKEYRNLYHYVLEMYYRLLLYHIGYKGIYTEYSANLNNNVEFKLYNK